MKSSTWFATGLRTALALATLAGAGCQRSGSTQERAAAKRKEAATATADPHARAGIGAPARTPQVKPPLPVAQPPADAEQLTGIEGAPAKPVFIKRLAAGAPGPGPGRNDTVSLNFTGWRLNGETFLSTKSRNRPVQQSLAVLAPGFTAAVMSMKKGERAMVWIPPELGYMGTPTDTPETTVYEIELVDFEPAPAVPPDVAGPPATATRTASGLAYATVKPGDGKTRPRVFDQVTYHYTAWDSSGKMFDSTEVRKRPKPTFVFREWPGLEEALTSMTVGERKRVWLDESHRDDLPGLPAGTLVYELELLEIKPMHAPPPTPPDVAAPPADAKKTAKGVSYKVLSPGTGRARPGPADTVRIHYSGWTTNGRLFDSSLVRQEPAQFPLSRWFEGGADALQTMVVGEKSRRWIPSELAYNNAPGRPAGMLVYDVELLEIIAAPPAAAGGGAAPAGKPH